MKTDENEFHCPCENGRPEDCLEHGQNVGLPEMGYTCRHHLGVLLHLAFDELNAYWKGDFTGRPLALRIQTALKHVNPVYSCNCSELRDDIRQFEGAGLRDNNGRSVEAE